MAHCISSVLTVAVKKLAFLGHLCDLWVMAGNSRQYMPETFTLEAGPLTGVSSYGVQVWTDVGIAASCVLRPLGYL